MTATVLPLLCAFGDAEAAKDALPDLRVQLSRTLPAYAIPLAIIPFRSFPLGPNGKVDRDLLAQKIIERIETRARTGEPDLREVKQAGSTSRPPSGVHHGSGGAAVLAQEIAALWSESLGLADVRIESELFDLGGDSILAIRTVALVCKTGGRLTIADVYTHATPLAIAQAALAKRATGRPTNPVTGDTSAAIGPPQRWFFDRNFENPHHWNQVVLLRCGMPIDSPALCRAVDRLAHRYPVLDTP